MRKNIIVGAILVAIVIAGAYSFLSVPQEPEVKVVDTEYYLDLLALSITIKNTGGFVFYDVFCELRATGLAFLEEPFTVGSKARFTWYGLGVGGEAAWISYAVEDRRFPWESDFAFLAKYIDKDGIEQEFVWLLNYTLAEKDIIW